MQPIVLAVDDNEIHCYTIVKILEHAGYRVIHASTGNKALMMALEHKPDVVLLDINLPDVNGFEVCSRLKADPQTQDIPVVFHTASNATAEAKNHAEMVGASGFLTYPIFAEHLLTVLQGTLAKSSDVADTQRSTNRAV